MTFGKDRPERAGACENRDADQGKRNQGRLDAARRIRGSVAYMLQHLNEPLQVSTLSAQAGFSPSSFFSLFKSVVGCGPMSFHIRARMQRAAELLEGTTFKVKEVAGLLGYHDPFYFSRVFKSVKGMAPSQHRAFLARSTPATGASLSSGNEAKSFPALNIPVPARPRDNLLKRMPGQNEELDSTHEFIFR